MKKLLFNRRFLCLLLLVSASVLSGCASSDVDRENRTERPWNSPTGWEQAGPMSTVMEQH